MFMIDTHCHLDVKEFNADRGDVIARARESGVRAIVNPASDLSSNEKILRISSENPGYVFACAGLDPVHCLRESIDDAATFIQEHCDIIVAIGEVGLDFHWSQERRKQKENFQLFIELAKELNKLLVVHAREAMRETLDTLCSARAEHVVLHCFSGTKQDMGRAVDAGFYISFATNICYRGSKALIRQTPLEYMLLETDSPYLHPLQKERNEPANVKQGLLYVADALGEEPDRIEKKIDKNSCKAFALKVR
jgi:TatD DNase family protein